jgi:hypothetical protein
MSKVFAALAASVDGYITGPNPNPKRPLGVGGEQLFDWYRDGDTPSAHFPLDAGRWRRQGAVIPWRAGAGSSSRAR